MNSETKDHTLYSHFLRGSFGAGFGGGGGYRGIALQQ